MQQNKKQDACNSISSFYLSSEKIRRLVIIGLLGTVAFDVVMYVDSAITGLPLQIPNVLGALVLGESPFAEAVGRLIHFGNGIGLALIFGFVALPILKKIVKLPTIAYGVIFSVMELVIAVWFGMLPALSTGVAGINIGPEVALVTFLRHIAFGVVLGISVRRWKY